MARLYHYNVEWSSNDENQLVFTMFYDDMSPIKEIHAIPRLEVDGLWQIHVNYSGYIFCVEVDTATREITKNPPRKQR